MGTLAPSFSLCMSAPAATPEKSCHRCHVLNSHWTVFWIVIFWCINSSVVMQVQVNRVSILVNNEKWKFWYKVCCS